MGISDLIGVEIITLVNQTQFLFIVQELSGFHQDVLKISHFLYKLHSSLFLIVEQELNVPPAINKETFDDILVNANRLFGNLQKWVWFTNVCNKIW